MSADLAMAAWTEGPRQRQRSTAIHGPLSRATLVPKPCTPRLTVRRPENQGRDAAYDMTNGACQGRRHSRVLVPFRYLHKLVSGMLIIITSIAILELSM